MNSIQRASNRIGIVGACFDKGQTKDGVQLAPKALRNAGLESHLAEAGWEVKDYGDVYTKELPKNDESNEVACKNAHIVAKATQFLQTKVAQCLRDDRLCLTLGGDHSVG